MIRFCTEAETKQAENRPLLLYRPRQQKEADRQVSRSYPTGNAMVTHASLRKEQQQQQRWASTFWSPRFTNCPPSAFRSRLDLSAFQKVKQLLRDSLCSANTPPQGCQRRPWAREGLDPGGKGAASLGSGAQERPPFQGTGGLFFCFFF